MKFMFVLATLLSITGASANAQDSSKKPPELTITEVIQAGQAMRQLGKFRFPPEVLMDMAVNIQQADLVQKAYQDAVQALVRQTYGSQEAYSDLQVRVQADLRKVELGQIKPEDRTMDKKAAALNEEIEKMAASPARSLLSRIKRSDLCLEKAEPRCRDENAIPVDVLRGLLPLVDK